MQGGSAPVIDFSKRLTLRVQHPHSRDFLDLYRSEIYTPSLVDSFTKRAVSVRIRQINLYEPLPELQENSLDVREFGLIDFVATHPDIYELPLTLARRARFIRIRHGKRAARWAL